MTENALASCVIGCSIEIHRKLGPGLLESVYETVLAHELRRKNFSVETQKVISVEYDDLTIKDGFRADLVVENSLIVELKSVEEVKPVHKKQLPTYLRLSDKRLGLLINFGESVLKDGIVRIANDL